MITSATLDVLGGISAEHFLNEYWQKKPLLIRQAFPGFLCPVSPDELAGLALEESVESRLIQEQQGEAHWVLENGPFEESRFGQLPATHWTLLIQQLDAWHEEINALKQHFSFIPNWRIDDIMASYAPQGGSVGPHYDQYDVFLLQAQGHRHWQIGKMCDEHSPQLEGTPLRILKTFEAQADWVLAPGDMLYLPPGLAHHGVAEDDCITLSVGFRAPTDLQLLNDFVDANNECPPQEHFYQDPDLSSEGFSAASLSAASSSTEITKLENIMLEHSPALVTQASIKKVKALMVQAIEHSPTFEQWFVEFSSSPKNAEILGEIDSEFSQADLEEIIEDGVTIQQNEGSRFVYTRTQKNELVLGVDGMSFRVPSSDEAMVRLICEHQSFSANELASASSSPNMLNVIIELFRQGSLYC